MKVHIFSSDNLTAVFNVFLYQSVKEKTDQLENTTKQHLHEKVYSA